MWAAVLDDAPRGVIARHFAHACPAVMARNRSQSVPTPHADAIERAMPRAPNDASARVPVPRTRYGPRMERHTNGCTANIRGMK